MPSHSVQHLTLDISGMHCAACSARVETLLRAMPGIQTAVVDLASERAEVTVESAIDTGKILQVITDAGYHARARGQSGDERRKARDAKEALRQQDIRDLTRTALLAVVILLAFMPDMGRMLLDPQADHLLAPALQFVFALIVQVFCALRFYRGAYGALRAGWTNMDVLVTLGTSAAFLLSSFNLFTGNAHHGGLYFEASVTVITLLLLGKILESRAKGSAREALEALAKAAPATAIRLKPDGSEDAVETEQLVIGDTVVIRPGGKVPVDGTVSAGSAMADESLITGESLPVERGIGDRVTAGSVISGGQIVVCVAALGDDTRLQKIARLLEDAEIRKSPVQQMADRISAVFVPIVLVIALISLIVWIVLGHGLEHAIIIAVSVLVVACPCALGLATPIALMAGANAAARIGGFITDHSAVEALGRVNRVVFDKTGTLSIGHPSLDAFETRVVERTSALHWAAALASRSDHPLDRALAEAHTSPLEPPSDFVALPGRGLSGKSGVHRLALGNAAFMRDQGITSADIADITARLQESGNASLAYLAVDQQLSAVFSFKDQPRPGVAEALHDLSLLDIKTTILSGDRQEAVSTFAQTFALEDARGGLTPADKIHAVETLRAEGSIVAVVGDGINDAPALRAADVGIAMGSGTETAKAAAAVTLATPDPRRIALLLKIGRVTRRTIATNLGFAFLFNGLGIPLAAMGKLSPAVAGAAMALSSVSVVINAWLLARKKFS